MRTLIKILASVVFGVFAIAAIAFVLLSSPYEVADEPTALMQAARLGHVEQVRELLAAGADVNEPRGYSKHRGIIIAHAPGTPLYGDTALMSAIESRDVTIVRTLLDAKADGTARDSWGRDIWEYAVNNSSGSGGDVMVLLATRFEMPPAVVDRILQQVGYTNDPRMLEFALSRPNSVGAREGALCGAAGRGDIEMMTRVLQTLDRAPRGSVVCAMNGPMSSTRKAAIELLISCGADPNGDDKAQPLYWATFGSQPGTAAESVPSGVRDIVELLLKHGADPHRALPGALSPIDQARHNGNEALARLLESSSERAVQKM